MKRMAFIGILVVVLMAVGAVAAFAAPGSPVRGFGMMGQGYGMMGSAQGAPYGYGHMGGSMMGDDLEELLGIDHADIHAAHVAGKSLVDIAAEKGVTEAELVETILAGRQAALDQAVEAGRLTQDSADQMLGFMQANIETMVNAKGMQSMPGSGHMGNRVMGSFGRMGGMMDGNGSPGPCHGGGAPGQGTGVRNNFRYAPGSLQQG